MKIYKQQLWHFLFLIALLIPLFYLFKTDASFTEGSLWGITTLEWSIFAIISPIIHQIYVLVCWRSELYYKSISKSLGKRGFKLYKIGFTILIITRPVIIVLLAISSAYTMTINATFSYVLSAILLIPAVYLGYSVAKYFDIDKAFGIDHFYPEKAKDTPFVKKGIFKYTSNGMYLYGFLIIYIPAILLQSKAALALALFHHLYIWVHYFFTELPDIKYIYGKKASVK
jgi:Phospholipid methyltransferase